MESISKKFFYCALAVYLLGLAACNTRQSAAVITATSRAAAPAAERRDGGDTLASLSRAVNYTSEQLAFTLPEATPVYVTAVGETINIDSNTVWNCDAVEIYLDLLNDKQSGFNSRADDRQYIMGRYNRIQKVRFKLLDQNPGSYSLEAGIPWAILGTEPAAGLRVGFDFAIIDNDGQQAGKEAALGKVAWHARDGDIYINTSLWGNLVLLPRGGTKASDSATVYAAYAAAPPVIDGKPDRVWEKLPSTSTRHLLYGPVTGDSDVSATLKTTWDQENLYFLVEVTDNKKVYQTYTRCDYGWIEDASGNRIWEMELENSRHAGGALKNRLTDTTLYLPAGKYAAGYVSDESHASSMWDDDAPTTPFYGIAVTKRSLLSKANQATGRGENDVSGK